MVTSWNEKHDNIPDQAQRMGLMNATERNNQFSAVASHGLQNLPLADQMRRTERMAELIPTLRDIEQSLMNDIMDGDTQAPFNAFSLLTTISNLTMMNEKIVSTPSSISYNENPSKLWVTYECYEDPAEYIKIEINGENCELNLSGTNPTEPAGGWINVSVRDVIRAIEIMHETGKAPDLL